MKYLLDASAVIDWLNGRPRALELFARLIAEDGAFAANAITVAEIYSGLADDERGPSDRMFGTFEYWPIDEDVAKRAGSLRNEYRRKGRPLSVPDTLMAAHAILREATLVTGNVRDFPMPELKILRLDH